ncbi:protein-tyrosine phosphatase family protein [Paenibacillus contaminans]|uniref:Protein tyrosine phosphatase n=1 Tax=Paenibacillus contaminans TaxID=450362 RepID=A0A329LX25_9BACL|nr:dual specificity protein phosphatase family protein [Paenibacillus contaminans]RAV11752.1 protein tyrosine phosphatase [Paenibacillus contaminans]
MEKSYQALHDNKIFMCGAADVEQVVKNEQCEVIVDLRGEANQCAFAGADVEWIKIALGDDAVDNQEALLKQAADEVVKAYREGKKVAFHCNGGRGRTGAVAVATLIELGVSGTIEEAERLAKCIRPILNVKPAQKEALQKLYP